MISSYQRGILENWGYFWNQWFQNGLRLLPLTVVQDILRNWNFGFQFIREGKGNPELERKITTEVAGYGSQLGTLTDFLGVLVKTCALNVKSLKDVEDVAKYSRFVTLARNIDRAKGIPVAQ